MLIYSTLDLALGKSGKVLVYLHLIHLQIIATRLKPPTGSGFCFDIPSPMKQKQRSVCLECLRDGGSIDVPVCEILRSEIRLGKCHRLVSGLDIAKAPIEPRLLPQSADTASIHWRQCNESRFIGCKGLLNVSSFGRSEADANYRDHQVVRSTKFHDLGDVLVLKL